MADKLDAPNYTQIPNRILGNIAKGNKVEPGLMASLEGSELKVLLAVCRLTFGFHQNERRASLTMIEELTGLSRQGVVNAAGSLEGKGLIERGKDGGVTLWKVVVNSVDYQDINEVVNSVDQGVNSVDQGSQMSRPPSKKETGDKPEKEIPIEAEAAAYKKICNLYQREIGGLSGIVGDMIRDDVAAYPVEWIERAVEVAVKSNSRKWSYVEGILKNWKAIGGPQNDKPRGRQSPTANGRAKPAGTITGLQGRAIDDPIQKRCNIKTGETYWFDLRTNQRVPDPDGS